MNPASEEAEWFKLAVEAARLGTWELNPITGEMIWSDYGKQALGIALTADVSTYNSFLEGINTADQARVDRIIQAVLQGGNTDPFQLEYHTENLNASQIRRLRLNGRAFVDEHGTTCRVIGTVMDLTLNQRLSQPDRTEPANALDELQRNNFELQQSNENLRQFAQVASHDLQEPLRKIQAFSDILRSQFADNLSDGEADMIRRIQKSAKRMQFLIKDLLMYSLLAIHRDPFVRVVLKDVVEDALSDLELAITENSAVIDVGPLPSVLGSTSRLRQLFQNLIANALKFRQRDREPRIHISARTAQPDDLPVQLQNLPTQSFYLIAVQDNGIGFDEKYKDRIFSPFQQLHNKESVTGTGIGLAICYRVAESHGGAIDVSSTPGAGSTFKVFLPSLSK